jgi:drug/metabolite transporter (DMT)-like permease
MGIILALAAAAVWGGGDFCGGLATRRQDPFRVLFQGTIASLVLTQGFMFALGERLPSLEDALWAGSAGVFGALGLALLYQGLAQGSAVLVSPVAAVVGAALPVLVSSLVEGLPTPLQALGFAAALGGIWMVSRAEGEVDGRSRRGLGLAVLSGVGFAGFLVLIAQVESGSTFSPLLVAKLTSLLVALVVLRRRGMRLPTLGNNPYALLAGVMDVGANALYLVATRFTRLDVAAVLGSLYPAGTVLLSRILLKEEITPLQGGGVVLCLAAIGLITL